AEYERQPHRGQQRIVERDKAGDDIEDAKGEPEQEPAPSLDLERADDFENAGDQHHDADNIDAGDGGHDDAAKGNHAGDDVNDAESDDPTPFGPERRDAGP